LTVPLSPPSVFPNPSVPLSRIVLAVQPSAPAPSSAASDVSICQVLTSAINVTSRLWLLLLMLAVTTLIPAVWLVTLISTVPSGFVVIVEATAAPFSSTPLTLPPKPAV
ncbi:hypothetical protein, partial [Escherichia coli]|uniref:hypothetical protein n=1 Tax=Escherichia coli TaxID=562 RepID=UPI00148E0A11|nr:hypothetical protein [Escherichia coli]